MTTHAVEIALLTLVGFSNFGILLLLCLNSLLACLHLGLFGLNHLCKGLLVFVLKFKLAMHAKKKMQSKALAGIIRTSPLVLTSIPLMMYPLLYQMLMCRIVRIQNLDSLPPALALVHIVGFKRKTRQQHSNSQALRIHTSLYQLLLTGQVFIPANETKRDGHRRDPGSEDDGVSVLLCPLLQSLTPGFRSFDLSVLFTNLFFVPALFGVGFQIIIARESVCFYDCFTPDLLAQ